MALRRRIREMRSGEAHWAIGHNVGWVRWDLEDGRHAFCAIRRRADLLTGELGVSHAPVDIEFLPLRSKPAGAGVEGCRVSLGDILHGREQWWSSGGTEKGLHDRLDWIAQQLQMRLRAFLTETTLPEA